jgi:hypothetical protein
MEGLGRQLLLFGQTVALHLHFVVDDVGTEFPVKT